MRPPREQEKYTMSAAVSRSMSMHTMMGRVWVLLFSSLFLILPLAASTRADEFSAAGPHKVEVLLESWTDAARGAGGAGQDLLSG